jgi:hypothetical protein
MPEELNILLAIDDRYFSEKVVKLIGVPIQLTMVEDAEQLLQYLKSNDKHLPDFIFQQMQGRVYLRVITVSSGDTADETYRMGARYYLQCDFSKLPGAISKVLSLFHNSGQDPPGKNFIQSGAQG